MASPRRSVSIGVPAAGWYEEIFNSDSKYYGGTNIGNYEGAEAQEPSLHGRPYRITIAFPPLGVAVFKPKR
ncbi:MAG: alpha amylase C-terminal domain-containing protein [Planctomycetota bacterium]|jgi:1,4-alpha-glucan branching enzyme